MSRYFILTLSASKYVLSTNVLPDELVYLTGQLEYSESGYLHWQLVAITKKKSRISALVKLYPTAHVEKTKSDAALSYVHKEDTRVPGTEFTLGKVPFQRNSETDWNEIWAFAITGQLEEIPADIRIRCYSSFKKIKVDYAKPQAHEKTTNVYVGPTGTGKSRLAWHEAGLTAFPKNPNTKFWDGYRGQENVIIDEFRGRIDISYLLLWLDRYPCIVEIKGSGESLCAKNIWITSNLHPRQWYPELDDETYAALLRRLKITLFRNPL